MLDGMTIEIGSVTQYKESVEFASDLLGMVSRCGEASPMVCQLLLQIQQAQTTFVLASMA